MDRSTVSRTIYMHQRVEDPSAAEGESEARIQWRPTGKAVKVGGWGWGWGGVDAM